jgi:hypothetical protein
MLSTHILISYLSIALSVLIIPHAIFTNRTFHFGMKPLRDTLTMEPVKAWQCFKFITFFIVHHADCAGCFLFVTKVLHLVFFIKSDWQLTYYLIFVLVVFFLIRHFFFFVGGTSHTFIII